MLLYRDVQWHYKGVARDRKGKAAATGTGLVRTTATHLMVYDFPADAKPSYTFACSGIEGVIPVGTRLNLKVYDLVFTRAPVQEVGTPGQLPAAPPPLVSSANALRATGAGTAAAPPPPPPPPSSKRKPTSVSPAQPPSSPPRGPKCKPPSRKRSASTAAAPPKPPKQPKQPKRRKISTSANVPSGTLSSDEAPRPPDDVLMASTSAASAPVTLTSTASAPVASTSRETLEEMRVNPLTAAEKAKRQKYSETMHEWQAEWVARAEARHEREKPLRTAVSGAAGPEGPLFEIVNGRIGEKVRHGPPLGPESPARRHISSQAETVQVLAGLASDPFGLPPVASTALRHICYDPFVSDSDGAVLEPSRSDGASLELEDVGAQYCLRTVIFRNAAALRTFLAVYKDKFGDECWVAATLRSLALYEVDRDRPVAMHYAGLTIRATPHGRVVADMQSGGSGSRCLNLLRLARELHGADHAESNDGSDKGTPASIPIELVVHELVDLRLPDPPVMKRQVTPGQLGCDGSGS